MHMRAKNNMWILDLRIASGMSRSAARVEISALALSSPGQSEQNRKQETTSTKAISEQESRRGQQIKGSGGCHG